jgi:hypothetical protein
MTITGAAEEIARFKQTCIDEHGLDFNALIPMPAEVDNDEHVPGSFPDWYVWSCQHWGTKWNACRFHVEINEATCFKCTFDTAFAPPIPVFEKLGKMFPTLDFELSGGTDGRAMRRAC